MQRPGKISEAEIRLFATMLKQQWKGIVKSHNKSAAVKKAVKTVTKKVTTKKAVKKTK